MALEVERKYLHVDFAALRAALAAHGAQCLGAHFESNWIFDTEGGTLCGSARLLRLRRQEWADKTRCGLTLKLPVAAEGRFKVREERESEVADAEALCGILQGLGYRVVARYEKVREPWRLEGVEVELDVLPFMEVAELEGEAARIECVQGWLCLDNAQISTMSYHELHQMWLQKSHKPPQLSFVFSEAQRKRWRMRLGLPDGAVPVQACGGASAFGAIHVFQQ